MTLGPPCGSFVWINSNTHGRTRDEPLGDQKKPYVNMGSLSPSWGLEEPIDFTFFFDLSAFLCNWGRTINIYIDMMADLYNWGLLHEPFYLWFWPLAEEYWFLWNNRHHQRWNFPPIWFELGSSSTSTWDPFGRISSCQKLKQIDGWKMVWWKSNLYRTLRDSHALFRPSWMGTWGSPSPKPSRCWGTVLGAKGCSVEASPPAKV